MAAPADLSKLRINRDAPSPPERKALARNLTLFVVGLAVIAATVVILSLDVSTDPVVSLWFALHASSTSRRRVTFSPVRPQRDLKRETPPRPQDVADVPTLHLYIAAPFSGEDIRERFAVVYLSRLETLPWWRAGRLGMKS